MAERAEESYSEEINLDEYLIDIIGEGQKALDNTPKQLPVLKEAGVVDSGGQGLLFLLRGALNALNNDIDRDIDLSEESEEEKTYKLSFSLSCKEADYEKIIDSIRNLSSHLDSEFNNNVIEASLQTDHPHQVISCLLYTSDAADDCCRV